MLTNFFLKIKNLTWKTTIWVNFDLENNNQFWTLKSKILTIFSFNQKYDLENNNFDKKWFYLREKKSIFFAFFFGWIFDQDDWMNE